MNDIESLARTVLDGGVLLVPTDTNYALACAPHDSHACDRVYRIKKRAPSKPLTLFIDRKESIEPFVRLDASQRKLFDQLADLHWPGPLNIVLPAGPQAPKHKFFDPVTISVACNKNLALQELLERCGTPLAMTSANISGTDPESLITQTMAEELFKNDVDGIVVNSLGRPETRQSSTIVEIRHGNVVILRQGDITITDA